MVLLSIKLVYYKYQTERCLMYYTIYKITNTIDSKIYVGVHKTTNLDDGYMGSGTYLKRAQEKYGVSKFKKEILQVFDSQEEMFEMESVIVNEEFISREDTYNLKIGGFGGFDHLNDGSEEHRNRSRNASDNANSKQALVDGLVTQKQLLENDEWKAQRSDKFRATLKKTYANGYAGGFSGKNHTQETKDKIGAANAQRKGASNSQFGTIWIYNIQLKQSKKIQQQEFPAFEESGWLKGRKMKF